MDGDECRGKKRENRGGERELEERRNVDGNSAVFLGGRPAPQQRSERRKQRRQTQMGRKGWGRGSGRHKREYEGKRA